MIMFDILFARTFVIIGGMLVITAIAAYKNKVFETKAELWATVIGSFIALFAIMIFSDTYPINLILVAIFSGLMGWSMGPAIEELGVRHKRKQYMKTQGIVFTGEETLTEDQKEGFESSFNRDDYHQDRQSILFQAIFSTALAVFATAGMVFLTNINFGFLGGFLTIALIILIIMGLLNSFVFHSKKVSLFKSYFGVLLFVLFLLYDFDRLEKMANNETWGAAINIAVSIYLDIINLFLYILEILTSSD